MNKAKTVWGKFHGLLIFKFSLRGVVFRPESKMERGGTLAIKKRMIRLQNGPYARKLSRATLLRRACDAWFDRRSSPNFPIQTDVKITHIRATSERKRDEEEWGRISLPLSGMAAMACPQKKEEWGFGRKESRDPKILRPMGGRIMKRGNLRKKTNGEEIVFAGSQNVKARKSEDL